MPGTNSPSGTLRKKHGDDVYEVWPWLRPPGVHSNATPCHVGRRLHGEWTSTGPSTCERSLGGCVWTEIDTAGVLQHRWPLDSEVCLSCCNRNHPTGFHSPWCGKTRRMVMSSGLYPEPPRSSATQGQGRPRFAPKSTKHRHLFIKGPQALSVKRDVTCFPQKVAAFCARPSTGTWC